MSEFIRVQEVHSNDHSKKEIYINVDKIEKLEVNRDKRRIFLLVGRKNYEPYDSADLDEEEFENYLLDNFGIE